MSVLVLQGANLGILDKLQNGYVGQLVFRLLSLLNPWLVERNLASLPACLFLQLLLSQAVIHPSLLDWFCSWALRCYSNRLHDFFVSIPRCYEDIYIHGSFPHATRLSNPLPVECFLLTYDLMALSLELLDNFYLLVLSIQLSYILIFFFLCFL